MRADGDIRPYRVRINGGAGGPRSSRPTEVSLDIVGAGVPTGLRGSLVLFYCSFSSSLCHSVHLASLGMRRVGTSSISLASVCGESSLISLRLLSPR